MYSGVSVGVTCDFFCTFSLLWLSLSPNGRLLCLYWASQDQGHKTTVSKQIFEFVRCLFSNVSCSFRANICFIHCLFPYLNLLFIICIWSFFFSNFYYIFSNNISKYACFLLIFPSTTISTEESSSQSRGTKTTIPYSIIRISGSFFMKGSVYHHNHHQFQKVTAQPRPLHPSRMLTWGGASGRCNAWNAWMPSSQCRRICVIVSPYLLFAFNCIFGRLMIMLGWFLRLYS